MGSIGTGMEPIGTHMGSIGTGKGPIYICSACGKHIITFYDGERPELYQGCIENIFGATLMSRPGLERNINYVKNFHSPLDFTFDISKLSDFPSLVR